MDRRGLLLLLAGAALASCGVAPAEPAFVGRRGEAWARQDVYTPLPGTGLQVFIIGDAVQHRVRWEESAPDVWLVTELYPNGDERQCRVDARGARPGTNLGEMRDTRGALTITTVSAPD